MKYSPEVYLAMRDGGLSNRRIGELLGVDEATVRRSLKRYKPARRAKRTVRDVLNELAGLLDA